MITKRIKLIFMALLSIYQSANSQRDTVCEQISDGTILFQMKGGPILDSCCINNDKKNMPFTFEIFTGNVELISYDGNNPVIKIRRYDLDSFDTVEIKTDNYFDIYEKKLFIETYCWSYHVPLIYGYRYLKLKEIANGVLVARYLNNYWE
jgi:hypothetical protein